MNHFIITGGLGAGKTRLTDTLVRVGYIFGSPAQTMKLSLARALSREWSADGNELDPMTVETLVDEMNRQETKAAYRLLLQGYGEYFTILDNYHWIERVMQGVKSAVLEARYMGDYVIDPPGTVYDSIRSPAETRGIRKVYPQAFRVHLAVSHGRQLEFLMNLGNTEEQAEAVLAHSSEHWFDDAPKDVQPDVVLNADEGDDSVLQHFIQWCAQQGLWSTVALLGVNNG